MKLRACDMLVFVPSEFEQTLELESSRRVSSTSIDAAKLSKPLMFCISSQALLGEPFSLPFTFHCQLFGRSQLNKSAVTFLSRDLATDGEKEDGRVGLW